MRPFAWYLNAAARTARALLPELFPPDDAFARARLPPAEYALYAAMEAPDRDHAVRVAKGLLARRRDVDPLLIRVALLHDLGKSGVPYRVWQRIVVHLSRPDLPPQPRLEGLAGVQQRKLHHPRYGAEMVRAVGGCEAVASLIERHHTPGDDPELALLNSVDDAT